MGQDSDIPREPNQELTIFEGKKIEIIEGPL